MNGYKKLIIVALVAVLLPTLFSCSNSKGEAIEGYPSIRKIQEYRIPNSQSYSVGITINTVITNTDTIVIWSKYKHGSVIIDRKPIKH